MPQLLPYSPHHFAALSQLHLPQEQERFTAYPAALIPATEADSNSLGVTICEGSDVVGYFVLSAGQQRDKFLPLPDPMGVAIRALSIDQRWQGRGIGSAAMSLLSNFASDPTFQRYFPNANHFLLVVNQQNPRAKRVYEKAGFEVSSERDGGKHGSQWIMQQSF